MLYKIHTLKAPWPSGAKVGDVIDLPYLPTWAVGKCSVAPDGAVATVQMDLPSSPNGMEGSDNAAAGPTVAELREQLDEALARKAAAESELHAARQQFGQSFTDQEHLHAQEIDRLRAEKAELQAKLDAKETDDGKAAQAVADAEAQAQRERADIASREKAKGDAAGEGKTAAAPAPAPATAKSGKHAAASKG